MDAQQARSLPGRKLAENWPVQKFSGGEVRRRRCVCHEPDSTQYQSLPRRVSVWWTSWLLAALGATGVRGWFPSARSGRGSCGADRRDQFKSVGVCRDTCCSASFAGVRGRNALSLIFTLIYGRVAAYNLRAEKVMVPLLDILQSIPVLGFSAGPGAGAGGRAFSAQQFRVGNYRA